MIDVRSGTNVCDACSIAYPMGTIDCPVCENVTRYVGGRRPDYDWQDRVAAALSGRVSVGGPAIEVRPVKDEHGRLWLYVPEIRAAGYVGDFETFDRFVTPEGLVELQGFDAPRARWWIEAL